ncbi:MAG: endonuclease III [Verrucomicrobiota bacterium]|jgi:endonuclease-3|nr:endonuclease III [Verrucomicrobiota bacterium]
MPRESQAAKRERLGKIIAGLQNTYPEAHCELNYRTPLQLMVATILSAQCTDKQVNIVTKGLFKKYKKAADFADVPMEQLQNDIRRIGLFRNKAKSIQNACRALMEHHKGKVPQTMPELVGLAGVGRKTANVILGNAFGINEGVVVDTHVARLCERLKISSAKTPEKIEKDLVKLVPREHWTMFSHWIIWHGRRRCNARKPDCPNCEIRELCPSAA